MAQDQDQAGLDALRRLERELATPQATPQAAALDPKALCQKYLSLKPTIEIALTVIERIPVIGKGAAAALRLVMQIADLLCPTV